MAARKFRFAVSARGRGDTLAGLKDFAKKAEDLGYSVLMLPDHFYEQLSPLHALVAAAQVTSTIRLATLTLANDFRHPVMLAKECATVDVLTDGRFEVGIGTGSQDADNRMAGMPIDPPGVKVERMAETLHILKAFLRGATINFAGKHYQVKGLPAYPPTVQKPHPPILLGASGPRMLRLAAREANIISVMGDMAAKRDVIREAAGARYDDIELNTLGMRVQIDGKPDTSAQGRPEGGYVGSRDQVIDQLLRQREETDVTYVSVIGAALEAFAPIVAKLAGT